MADRMVFFRMALTGGGADALDAVDGADRGDTNPLQDLDLAFTIDTSILYVHQLDADSAAAESSPDVIKPDTNAGDMRWILVAKVEDVSAYVAKAAYNAYTILYADSDNTPVPLTVAASTVVGRKSTGGIAALTAAEVRTLINVADGANAYIHPNHTGEVTSVADGATTITANAVTLAKLATQAADTVLANATAGAAVPTALALTEQTVLGRLTGGRAAAVTIGIADNNMVQIDQADAADDDYARFTANGIEGRSAAEVKADLHPAPGAIGETTPDTIRGKNKEIYKTATGDSPLTAAECSGTIVSNYGMTDADCIIDLPTAAEGLAFVCILPAVRARYFRLRCPSAQADKIYLLGVAGNDDGYVGVATGYATGASCSMFTFKASDGGFDWFCIPLFGSWVAG